MNTDNNPFQVEFILSQHTPIIHFQWHEPNATIRPTELKAKLDKWIIARKTNVYGNSDKRLKACKEYVESFNGTELHLLWNWLKGDNEKVKPAFNYTVKVIPLGHNIFSGEMDGKVGTTRNRTPKLENYDYPCYFGNQMKITSTEFKNIKDGEEYWTGIKRIKRMTFHKGVKVIINSPYEILIEYLKDEFCEFILKTNFGTRQSKGFGSFFLVPETCGFPVNHKVFFENKFDWMFDIKVNENTKLKQVKKLFECIDLFYKTLRSGINYSNRNSDVDIYYKSLMFQYVKDELKNQWDKKTIKQRYFNTDFDSLPENEDYQKVKPDYIDSAGNPKDSESPLFWEEYKNDAKFLWRDLLGLSTVQQWMRYSHPKSKRVFSIYKSHIHTDKDRTITRFKSPIVFKPIRTGEDTFRIFFEVQDNIKIAFANPSKREMAEESSMLGEEMKINTKPPDQNSWGLKFPETFDFDAFFKFVSKRDPSLQVMDQEHRKSTEYKILKKIRIRKA